MKLSLQSDEKLEITAKATAEIKGPSVSGTAFFTEYDANGAKYVHIKVELKGDPETISPGITPIEVE